MLIANGGVVPTLCHVQSVIEGGGEVKEALCNSMSIWILLLSVEMLQIYILPYLPCQIK